jgi:hypothetical protein
MQASGAPATYPHSRPHLQLLHIASAACVTLSLCKLPADGCSTAGCTLLLLLGRLCGLPARLDSSSCCRGRLLRLLTLNRCPAVTYQLAPAALVAGGGTLATTRRPLHAAGPQRCNSGVQLCMLCCGGRHRSVCVPKLAIRCLPCPQGCRKVLPRQVLGAGASATGIALLAALLPLQGGACGLQRQLCLVARQPGSLQLLCRRRCLSLGGLHLLRQLAHACCRPGCALDAGIISTCLAALAASAWLLVIPAADRRGLVQRQAVWCGACAGGRCCC